MILSPYFDSYTFSATCLSNFICCTFQACGPFIQDQQWNIYIAVSKFSPLIERCTSMHCLFHSLQHHIITLLETSSQAHWVEQIHHKDKWDLNVKHLYFQDCPVYHPTNTFYCCHRHQCYFMPQIGLSHIVQIILWQVSFWMTSHNSWKEAV